MSEYLAQGILERLERAGNILEKEFLFYFLWKSRKCLCYMDKREQLAMADG